MFPRARIRNSLLIAVALGISQPRARALTFNLTYDSSTVGAPSNFFTAFQYAINFYQNACTDAITINLQVGWGKINGQNLSPGNLGQSSTFQQGFYSFSQVKSALAGDAKTTNDAIAIAHLPASDPTGGALFVMANAEAKALGLLSANASGLDGSVGFSSTASYTFDPTNRAVSGKFDFIGLASHEITEVMGRYGLGQNGASSGRYSPIDLFRYLSSGVLDLAPTNGAYFSIDGGATVINTFNGTGGGDLSDWLGLTVDSYDRSLTLGARCDVSAGDLIEMDVLGYDLDIPSPILSVTAHGINSIVISWSSPSSAFTVLTNSDLATTNWHTAGYSITTIDGTNHSVSLAPVGRNVFFRLKE